MPASRSPGFWPKTKWTGRRCSRLETLPRPLDRIGHMLAVGRGEAQTDTQIGQVGVRIVPAVELRDRLGIALAGLGLDQHAFLEVRLEQSLQRHEKRRAVVAMPVGVTARHDLGVVDLHLYLWIARQRGVERVEQQVAVEAMPRRH